MKRIIFGSLAIALLGAAAHLVGCATSSVSGGGDDQIDVDAGAPTSNNSPTSSAPPQSTAQQASTASAPAAAACPHTGAPVIDPTTLPACGGANSGAHCLSNTFVPAALQAELATCPTGFCVPDVLIESGGEYIPKTCTSLASAEGRCMNAVLPEIAAEAATLPQDVCDSFERCAPCFDPISGKDTGVCHIACDPGPTKPAVTFATCCQKKDETPGHCVPNASVPSAEQSTLQNDTCTKGQFLCVPDEILEGTAPVTCQADDFFTGNYTGVCLSNCLDLDSIGVDQGSCDDQHSCVPCENPLTGDPTGAPGCTN